jgi:CO/xanthine dehydrogenase FAD-binding subunit
MIPTAFDYYRPGNLDEALRLLAQHPEAKLLAGGQRLMDGDARMVIAQFLKNLSQQVGGHPARE